MKHESHNLAGYLDGSLDAVARLRVEQHLAVCAECRRELDDLKAVGQLLRDYAASTPAPAFDPALWSKVRVRVTPAPRYNVLSRWGMALGGLTSAAVLVLAVISADLLRWDVPGDAPRPESPNVVAQRPASPDSSGAQAKPTRPPATPQPSPLAKTNAQEPRPNVSLRESGRPGGAMGAAAEPEPSRRTEIGREHRAVDGAVGIPSPNLRASGGSAPGAGVSPDLASEHNTRVPSLAVGQAARPVARIPDEHLKGETTDTVGDAATATPAAPMVGSLGRDADATLGTDDPAMVLRTKEHAPGVSNSMERMVAYGMGNTMALEAREVPVSTPEAQDLARQAKTAFNAGRPARAIPLYRAALQSGLEKTARRDAFLRLGDAHVQVDAPQDALHHYQAALNLGADREVWDKIGAVYDRLGDRNGAMMAYRNAQQFGMPASATPAP